MAAVEEVEDPIGADPKSVGAEGEEELDPSMEEEVLPLDPNTAEEDPLERDIKADQV